MSVDRMWLYVRNDAARRLAGRCTETPIGETSTLRYRGDETDEAYVRTLGPTTVCTLR
jgi:hypothetical protein